MSNGIKKSRENAQYHYDIGNDFYRLWLDETMTYSCVYFKSPEDTLVQAQKNWGWNTDLRLFTLSSSSQLEYEARS
ncbi:hypothetical protein JCM15765_12330 [Paradesulfitobacterium aromaticivorans]